MTQDDNWEPVSYRDLPGWVKEDSKPQRRIRNTYKTVFYGDPYDYLVQYTVDQDTLTISYWRTLHTFKREITPAKKFPSLLPGYWLVCWCWLWQQRVSFFSTRFFLQ